ncbi:hypothetical protein FRC15_004440, partial [Serendipita sp. 397]
PIAHPIVDPRTSPICLITKDPQREYKDLLQKHNINFISRVVGITKLKGKFSPYDARRELAKEYGLFLADERVVPLLPSLLGKAFFKKKKQPIPVNLQRTNLKAELESAISSTYLHQNAGTCTSIKIGYTGMDASKVVQNAEKAIPGVVRKLHLVNTKRGGKSPSSTNGVNGISEEEVKKFRETAWENIQSLGIKTHSSVCLPIWSCSLSERWIAPPSKPTKLKTKGVVANGVSEDIHMEGGSDEGDDTMSEGEDGKDNTAVAGAAELSQKMAESSLASPKRAKKALLNENPEGGKRKDQEKNEKEKKRKAEEQAGEYSRSTKKSKPSITAPDPSSVANGDVMVKSSQRKPKERSKDRPDLLLLLSNPGGGGTSLHAPKEKTEQAGPISEKPGPSKAGHEKTKKAERAKAADFMEDASVQKGLLKKQDASKSSSSSRVGANLSTDTPEKKKEETREGIEKGSERKEKVKEKVVEKVKEQVKGKEAGREKEKIKAKPVDEEQRAGVSTTNGTVRTSPPKPKHPETAKKPSISLSKASNAPPSTLKSALKKPDSTASLTPGELAEKKARKASFSVTEKKKEKLGKKLISGGQPGHGKSGKGGQSKASLVGRGPKM